MAGGPTAPRGRAAEPTRRPAPQPPVAVLGQAPEGRLARFDAAVRGLPEPVRLVGSAVGRAAAAVLGVLC